MDWWWQTAVTFVIAVVSLVGIPAVATGLTRHWQTRTELRQERIRAVTTFVEGAWEVRRASGGGDDKAFDERLSQWRFEGLGVIVHVPRKERAVAAYVLAAIDGEAWLHDGRLTIVAVNLASWARGDSDLRPFKVGP